MASIATDDQQRTIQNDRTAYSRLPLAEHEIRVLKILHVNPLRCTFERVSLKSSSYEAYKAVSWTWGDGKLRASITVDESAIDIPARALEVVTKLCIAHKHSCVWIDAICINQNDIAERNGQVAIMNEIYTHASDTLVWLGDDDGTTEQAIYSMDALLQWRKTRFTTTGRTGCDDWCQDKVHDPFRRSTDWMAIASFFSSSWFTRFWVIQEVALSARSWLFRGRYRCPWNSVAQAVHHIAAHMVDLEPEIRQTLTGIHNANVISMMQRGQQADMLLLDGHRFGATDPRDRAFALYGLLGRHPDKATLRQAFRPDYGKSLVQTYIQITKAAILSDSYWLRLLLGAQQTVPRSDARPTGEEFPSWLPRYDQVEDLARGSFARVRLNKSTQACLWTQAECRAPSNEVLSIAGFMIDTIETVCGVVEYHELSTLPHDSSNILDPLLVTLRDSWESACKANNMIPKLKLSEQFRDTLILHVEGGEAPVVQQEHARQYSAFIGRYWDPPRPPVRAARVLTHESVQSQRSLASTTTEASDEYDFYEVDNALSDPDDSDGSAYGSDMSDSAESYGSLDDIPATGMPPGKARREEQDKEQARSFLRDILHNAANRSYLTTRSGRMGSATRRAQTGDCIVVLCGLPVPVLLRPHGEHYEYIGDAYLNGIMAGEYIGELDATGRLQQAKQFFDLR